MKYFILYMLPLDVNTSTIYFIFFSVFFTTIVMIPMIRDIALRRSKLVIPNHRSSHNSPTIRGGGILFPLAVLLFYVLNDFQYTYFVLGTCILAIISFLDDIYTLSSKLRFSIQLLGVLLLLHQAKLLVYWERFLFL